MQIEILKRADGHALLRCRRADGSTSWQRQDGGYALHFPPHDLTHFVVETRLGLRDAFFGLVAKGWDVEDTTGKGARGKLPAEAILAEFIVGFLDVERASGGNWPAADYVEQLARAGLDVPPAVAARITDDALREIRRRRDELIAAWTAVPPGESLRLAFDPAALATS